MRFRSNAEIAIHVPDLSRAESFYAGVLGFTLIERTEEMIALDTGVFRLYVKRDSDARSFIPSLDVPDAAAARRHLEEAGCQIEQASATGFYFSDPFGLVIDVVQRG